MSDEADTKVVCRICGKKFKYMNGNHIKMHGITHAEYVTTFPDTIDDFKTGGGWKLMVNGEHYAGENHHTTTHGHCTDNKSSPTFRTYKGMLARCLNTEHISYAHYGGRGITVCERWQESFTNFLEDMGVRPEGTTLDRIDNDLGYCKENCQWLSIKEQNRKKATTTISAEIAEKIYLRLIDGLTMPKIAKEIGCGICVVRNIAQKLAWKDVIAKVEAETGKAYVKTRCRIVPETALEMAIRVYKNEHIPTIAKMYGCNPESIYCMFRGEGFHANIPQQARKLLNITEKKGKEL